VFEQARKDGVDDLVGRFGERVGLAVGAETEGLVAVGATNVNVELDEVSFEIPSPLVVVGDDGVDFAGHHRHGAGGGFEAHGLEFGDDGAVDLVVIGEAAFDVEAFEGGEIDARVAVGVETGAGGEKKTEERQQGGGEFHRGMGA
jgi:hypothetical protein